MEIRQRQVGRGANYGYFDENGNRVDPRTGQIIVPANQGVLAQPPGALSQEPAVPQAPVLPPLEAPVDIPMLKVATVQADTPEGAPMPQQPPMNTPVSGYQPEGWLGPNQQADQAAPQVSPQDAGGFLSNIKDPAKKEAIWDAMIQAGAGLLGAKNLREGMAAGFAGFNKGYNDAYESNKAKYNNISGTPYFWYQKPDGSFGVVDDAGKPAPGALEPYLLKKVEREAEVWKNKKQYEKQLESDNKAKVEADKQRIEAVPDLAQADNAINSLRGMAQELGTYDENKKFIPKSDTLTGPFIGPASSIPLVGSALNPKAVDLEERVGQELIKGLKNVLGTQFTEKEGQQFIRRGYNKNLDEQQNHDRLVKAANDLEYIKQNREAALEYFSKHKTLEGFIGSHTAGQKTPSSTGFLDQTGVEAKGEKYDPNYVYKLGPNGELMRKRK